VSSPWKKPIIGILGGIGSGKSTVAAEFGKLGCKVINADKIAHELINKPSVRKKIIACFGNRVLDKVGSINRKKLADIVFSDNSRLSALNDIVHRPVLARVERLIAHYNGQKRVKAIVLDMPLLVEVGWAKRCDKLVFVDCKRQFRVSRSAKAGICDENQFKIRENFQISLDNKAILADNMISNNSDFSALARQVADVFSCIVDNG